MTVLKNVIAIAAIASVSGLGTGAWAEQHLTAASTDRTIVLDGDAADWAGISGATVPLAGKGGVESVDLRAAVKDGRIYVLATWEDSTRNILHKPYKWNESAGEYKKDKQKEDRFAISLRMSGDFSANKISGSPFEADIWHWKASRSNPAGIAHDKMWKVSNQPFEKSKEWPTPDGGTIHMARLSDQGDRLYKPQKFDTKQDDIMNRYDVNLNAAGSIADVKAKGVWRDGRWYLEMSRKLDTGHDDDAVIPVSGAIEIAIAAFNNVDGRKHSTSEIIVLHTDGNGS